MTNDNLRHNDVAISGDTVLRIDVIGLRVEEAEFMGQLLTAHRKLTATAA